MTGARIGDGGLVDRNRPLRFRFDGRELSGLAGDTLTSALMGAGIDIVGRSFKYHRPRGVWGAWTDDPNAIFDIRLGAVTRPNCHGATTRLEDGMELRAVNAWPSAGRDIKGVLDRFSRFLPAGFYYKTFMWPDWHVFEPSIRRMAGLGRVRAGEPSDYIARQVHDRCDLLVVGGGPAGLRTAREAAETGLNAVLVEDHDVAGGSLHARGGTIEGMPAKAWLAAELAAIGMAGGRVLLATTATGIYDHNLVTLVTRGAFAEAPSLRRMRAKRIVIATGAIDRPLAFANNDLPGIMSVGAALDYLGRYAVLPGKHMAILSPAESDAGPLLRAAGADVVAFPASSAASAFGTGRVRGIEIDGRRHECDTILCAAGPSPLVHLWCHAGGRLLWDAGLAAFVPDESAGPRDVKVIGAARGSIEISACLDEAGLAARGETLPSRQSGAAGMLARPGKGRQWIDFQNDVTVSDVRLAARENYASVEHLKRYTTLGMGTDQGKTSNVNGLAVLADVLGREIHEVGTTRFRPPYVPVELELFRGSRRGLHLRPLKRSVLEAEHRALDAAMGEYGGWLRPAWYGRDGKAAARAEALRTRQAAGIADASPLGKIEVMGPDAADFLDFVYYNSMSTLKPGHVRYGFMLTERGVVFDDGVLARLGQSHFIVSCSSSHVDGVAAMLEAWRQDGNDPDRIFVHDVTQNWATITVCGPKARAIVATLDTGIDLSSQAFPHMTIRQCEMDGVPTRIARVSFTGDASYEISVPRRSAAGLWRRVLEAGSRHGAGPLGMEAQAILRAEKGYIIVGKDTDGETMPHDLGFDGPRQRKTKAYVGDRGLRMEVACDPDRPRLVGLEVERSESRLPEGAHIVGEDGRSAGFVTSSYDSPSLGRPIALALLRNGYGRMGQPVSLNHLGTTMSAKVVARCFFDADGSRLDA